MNTIEPGRLGRITLFVRTIGAFIRATRETHRIMRTISRKFVLISWFCVLTTAVLEIVSVGAFGYGLQRYTSNLKSSADISASVIILAGIILVGQSVIREMLNAFENFRRQMTRQQFRVTMDRIYAEHMPTLDLARLRQPGFEKIRDNAQSKGRDAIVEIWEFQLQWIGSIIVAVSSFAVILSLDSFLLVIAFLPIVPQIMSTMRIRKRERQLWDFEHIDRRYHRLYEGFLTSITRLTQTKLFEGVGVMKSRFLFHQSKLKETFAREQTYSLVSRLYRAGLSALCLITGYIYMAKGIFLGTMTVGGVYTLYGMLRSFRWSADNTVNYVVEMYASQKEFEYHELFMAQQPLIDESSTRDMSFGETPKITMHDVLFSYPREDKTHKVVLQGCSFSIRPGAVVAIAGPNGSGKSTALKLLIKQYVPDKGFIRISNMPLSEISQRSWNSHIACMDQHFSVGDLKISLALTYEEEDTVDLRRLKAASRIAGVDSFVEILPKAYETQIGSDWPDGVDFSGGQEQRLMLAAALYRLMHPRVRIGIFDEPMSNCDQETKNRFYRAITEKTVFNGKTIIVVAHDPTYLELFDEVILFDKGSVRAVLNDPGEIAAYKDSISTRTENAS